LGRAWNKRLEWEEMGKKAKIYARLKIPDDPVKYFYDELISLQL
jgi:hypothetical protein